MPGALPRHAAVQRRRSPTSCLSHQTSTIQRSPIVAGKIMIVDTKPPPASGRPSTDFVPPPPAYPGPSNSEPKPINSQPGSSFRIQPEHHTRGFDRSLAASGSNGMTPMSPMSPRDEVELGRQYRDQCERNFTA